MTPRFDVAVIGGGIVGLAHAWMAVRRRQTVVMLDRSAAAEGASIRNFGMIWPIGQPAGVLHLLAMRSRELWLELNKIGALQVAECGSIHLAHRDDELAVQEEFCAHATHDVCLLTRSEVTRRSNLVNTDSLVGGMFSPTELRVDPRVACARIASWLNASHDVQCCFGSSVTAIDDGIVRTSDGRRWQADRIVVCSGSDLQTLYPEILSASGLVLCKLQMLRSSPQPGAPHAPPHLASGLTLRHYKAFAECPSLNRLKLRVESESPELNRFGIHVMAPQFANGEIILGDSHEYGEEITPFDKTIIDELIVRECRKVFRLADWSTHERWSGIYAKHLDLPVFESQTVDGVHIFVGTGGAGMTMSFGLAERAWRRWLGET